MRNLHLHFRIALLVLANGIASGCEDAEAPPFTPSIGWLRVLVTTTGVDLDRNGYTLELLSRPGPPQSVAANSTIIWGGLTVASHTLRLDGIAPNCRVGGGNVRTVTVESRDTTDVVFPVTCDAVASLRVTITTTGIDPDENGYRVKVTGPKFSFEDSVATNGTRLVSGMGTGDHMVTLEDFTSNCDATDLNPRTVAATSGDTLTVAFKVTCAPVDQLAFVSETDAGTDIIVINSNGTGARNLTNHPAADRDPAWSPDRRRIAFTSTRAGNSDIYVMQADGSTPVQLTTDAAFDYSPAWSPDGRAIAFVSVRDGNPELYLMNADGTNPRRLTTNAAKDTDPAWSPDGSRIAITSDRDGRADIYIMTVDGTSVVRMATFASNPAWSPDGKRLAFTTADCEHVVQCTQTIALVNVDLPGVTDRIIPGSDPVWSPDGRQLAYTAVSCGYYYYYYFECHVTGIGVVRPNGSKVQLVAFGPASNPAWRP